MFCKGIDSAKIHSKKKKKRKRKQEWNWQSPTHPVTCVFSDENLVVGIPEANSAIVGGADTQVALSSELAEGKARHHVFVARELT